MTGEWWHDDDTARVRYEDLAANPHQELQRIINRLGVRPRRPIAEAIRSSTLSELRKVTGVLHHFWQGRPGLWKCLLPSKVSRTIAAWHRGRMKAHGYICDPDEKLTIVAAEAYWRQITE